METDVSGYRPVSAPAVLALITGAISALALASPFFWIVPLLAVGLALVGLADVRRPGAEKVGRTAAIVGLALAIGFGAQAVSATATARWISGGRARAAAELWIDAIREGRLDDARSMCDADAAAAVDAVAACCGASGSRTIVATFAGEAEGSWAVKAVIGECAVEVTLNSTSTAWQGRAGERWMVARCDVR